MKPEEIKTRLRDEMADLAPDRLEDLLAACDAQPQEHARAAGADAGAPPPGVEAARRSRRVRAAARRHLRLPRA
ncbi:MAG: hypothetical protein V8T10_09635 [Merdibacter sp.]